MSPLTSAAALEGVRHSIIVYWVYSISYLPESLGMASTQGQVLRRTDWRCSEPLLVHLNTFVYLVLHGRQTKSFWHCCESSELFDSGAVVEGTN